MGGVCGRKPQAPSLLSGIVPPPDFRRPHDEGKISKGRPVDGLRTLLRPPGDDGPRAPAGNEKATGG